MASISWENKYKSGTETKAHFRHNEKDARLRTKAHKNCDIDKTKTHLNYSIEGRSYDERVSMYDDMIADVQSHMTRTETYVVKKGKHQGETRTRTKSVLRKDAVTCIGLEVSVPIDLPESKYKEWFANVHGIYCDFFGRENVVDTDIHYDEIHEYLDPETKKMTKSRVHAHTNIFPRTSDGRLCAKEISSRENIIKLNEIVEEMTQREFGIQFNTGETPRKKSVERLKVESLRAENKQATEQLEQTQQQIEVLAEVAKKDIKLERKGIKGLFQKTGYYTMDEQEHEEFMQAVEDMKRLSHNTVMSDKDREAIATERAEIERLRREQEQIIKQQSEQLAQRMVRNAMLSMRQKEQEAEQAKQMAEQAESRYKALSQKEEAYIIQEAIKRADKASITFKALDDKAKREMMIKKFGYGAERTSAVAPKGHKEDSWQFGD